MNGNLGAKEKIMDVVEKLLRQKKDMSKITNREIAFIAGVNSALINYYYQSRENLIHLAVGNCMEDIAETILHESSIDQNPIIRLKSLMKAISDFAFDNFTFAEVAFNSEIKNGGINTVQMIIPLLKEILRDTKTDVELKLMAFQLIIPMQALFLNAATYSKYLFIDAQSSSARNELLDMLVDNLFDEDRLPSPF